MHLKLFFSRFFSLESFVKNTQKYTIQKVVLRTFLLIDNKNHVKDLGFWSALLLAL